MNQQVTNKLKEQSTGEEDLSIHSEEMKLAVRIREAIGDESVLGFSRKCRISEAAFRKYLAGAEPSTMRLVAIADTAGVNIAWLAAGRGPKKGSAAPADSVQPLDMPLSESDGFSSRLKEVIGDESVLSFANRCGFAESTLRNYLGGADPSRQRVIAIARTANVNFAWLATGEGLKKGSAAPAPAAPAPPLNTELLQAAVEGVQEGLQRINRTVPPDRHAQLIAAAYELLLDSQGHVSKDNVIKFIRAAA